MARTRQIKPEFWTDDDIATLEPCAKLLFIGLWGLADREGRLEDKPLSIHLRILPYERTIDPAILLGELAARRLIRRYVAPGKDGKPIAVIEIRSFRKHQHIHPDEQRSRLPAPPTPEEVPTAPVRKTPEKAKDSNGPRDPAASPEMPGNLSESKPTSDFRLPASDLISPPLRDPTPPEPRPKVGAGPLALPVDGSLTAFHLQQVFGYVRSEAVAGALPWTTPPDREGKASGFAARIADQPDAIADIVPTMQLLFRSAKDGKMSRADEVLRNPSFGFGAWCSQFTALREEHRGVKRVAPKQAPPRDQGIREVHYRKLAAP